MNEKHKFINTGAELIGASIGSAIGTVGGMQGAVIGASIGVVISKGLSDFAGRMLSHKERDRVNTVVDLVKIGIQTRIENGDQLRADGFFECNETNRTKAEELFEGILIKCKNEYEEKKLKYISKIFEKVAFDRSIEPEHANQVLNIAEQLSYRQLTILAFVEQNTRQEFKVHGGQNRELVFNLRGAYEEEFSFTHDLQFLLQDFLVLERHGLIFRKDNCMALTFQSVAPSLMILTQIGTTYYELLNLSEMPFEEFEFIPLLAM